MGVGPGAHGRLTLENVRTATVTHRRIGAYIASMDEGVSWASRETLGSGAAAEERILLGLRTIEGAAHTDLATLGLTGAGGVLEDLIGDGFLMRKGERIIATASGRPVLDGVLRALLT